MHKCMHVRTYVSSEHVRACTHMQVCAHTCTHVWTRACVCARVYSMWPPYGRTGMQGSGRCSQRPACSWAGGRLPGTAPVAHRGRGGFLLGEEEARLCCGEQVPTRGLGESRSWSLLSSQLPGCWGEAAVPTPFCFLPGRAPVLFGVAMCLTANSQMRGAHGRQLWPGRAASRVGRFGVLPLPLCQNAAMSPGVQWPSCDQELRAGAEAGRRGRGRGWLW